MTMRRGKWNAITDVAGVKVGHITIEEQLGNDDAICTGVTAILPHHQNWFEEKVPAAHFVLNGFGKSVGLVQIEELGVIESPIMLTNTFAVAPVLEGTLQYMLKQNEAIGDTTSSINIVVGECNDSFLNSIRLRSVQPHHAILAIEQAVAGSVLQGAVGAGKGMVCFGAKGGIGSSSRLFEVEDQTYTVGVLVLTNFGQASECRLANWLQQQGLSCNSTRPTIHQAELKQDGSIMIIVATDAPLNERQLKRVAKRAAIGLGRTGSHVHHGSGDIIISFSNAYTIPHVSSTAMMNIQLLRDDTEGMKQLFQGVIEATEEAIFQSLLHAKTTVGRKNRVVHQWMVDHQDLQNEKSNSTLK